MSTTSEEIGSLLSLVPGHVDLGDRKLYSVEWERISDGYSSEHKEHLTEVRRREDADLVSSETASGLHAPAIDLDLPCQLIPSSTPGNYHLYIDKEMPWKDYEKLLKVMVDVGLVEKGYFEMAKARRASFLRLPEKPKERTTDRVGSEKRARRTRPLSPYGRGY